jgi:hypothetical protein
VLSDMARRDMASGKDGDMVNRRQAQIISEGGIAPLVQLLAKENAPKTKAEAAGALQPNGPRSACTFPHCIRALFSVTALHCVCCRCAALPVVGAARDAKGGGGRGRDQAARGAALRRERPRTQEGVGRDRCARRRIHRQPGVTPSLMHMLPSHTHSHMLSLEAAQTLPHAALTHTLTNAALTSPHLLAIGQPTRMPLSVTRALASSSFCSTPRTTRM